MNKDALLLSELNEKTVESEFSLDNQVTLFLGDALDFFHSIPDESIQFIVTSPPYNQTDFVKDGIAIEDQLGKYAFVAYDLFVKHMLFYTGGVINFGIEILPTKAMQSQMSSDIAYFEGDTYNIMRQGRSSPPVPLFV